MAEQKIQLKDLSGNPLYPKTRKDMVEGLTDYQHPTHTAATAVTKADITALGIPAQDTNTTYGNATASYDGLMPKESFTQLFVLSGTAIKEAKVTSVNATAYDATLTVSNTSAVTGSTSTSTATLPAATTYAAGLMTAADKQKLDGLSSGGGGGGGNIYYIGRVDALTDTTDVSRLESYFGTVSDLKAAVEGNALIISCGASAIPYSCVCVNAIRSGYLYSLSFFTTSRASTVPTLKHIQLTTNASGAYTKIAIL